MRRARTSAGASVTGAGSGAGAEPLRTFESAPETIDATGSAASGAETGAVGSAVAGAAPVSDDIRQRGTTLAPPAAGVSGSSLLRPGQVGGATGAVRTLTRLPQVQARRDAERARTGPAARGCSGVSEPSTRFRLEAFSSSDEFFGHLRSAVDRAGFANSGSTTRGRFVPGADWKNKPRPDNESTTAGARAASQRTSRERSLRERPFITGAGARESSRGVTENPPRRNPRGASRGCGGGSAGARISSRLVLETTRRAR